MEGHAGTSSTQDAVRDPDFDAAALIGFLGTLARDLTRAGTSAEEARVLLVGDLLAALSGQVRGLERARWIAPDSAESGATLELADERGRVIARLHAPRAKRHAWTYLVTAHQGM